MMMRYAMTGAGQVHVREWGRRDGPLLVLVHWTPLSGRMFEHVAPRFAEAGWRVLGYGRSAARGSDWDVGDWAEALVTVIGEGGPAVVLGGHAGASVAVEMALGWPGRIRALVLDGLAFLTPELRAALAGLEAMGRPAGDGVERLAWEQAARLLREYGLPVTPDRVWPVMIDYLETDFVSSAPVLARHDLEGQLAKLRLPVLLLGAAGDSLAASLDRGRRILPRAAWHRFEGADPVHFDERAGEFVAPVIDFLEDL
ncbi:alpha/beta fold hydrolase [Polymorphobacter sp.]|uniref:alpha/beta fold hydrolase n=1 Tax=Polymorphobacter sp. TaxID=1909290 RepID=UPI003F6EEFC6